METRGHVPRRTLFWLEGLLMRVEVVLPEIVNQRQGHWKGPNNAPLTLHQEVGDWVWEKWNAGQMDLSLSPPLQRDLVELKHKKNRVYPSNGQKLEEELGEVITARGWLRSDADSRGVTSLARKLNFNRQDWERLLYQLNMAPRRIEDYMQYSVLKLQGRVAANELNPHAKSPEIKQALAPYETLAAKSVFEASA